MNNTPTPEQLNEFKEWYCKEFSPLATIDLFHEDWLKEYNLLTAYANHVNAELLRKLAALQEEYKKLEKDLIRICEERKKDLQFAKEAKDEYLRLYNAEIKDLKQQLTDARKEIDKLTFMIENGLGWNDMINDNTPTA